MIPAAGEVYMVTNDINAAELMGTWEGLRWTIYKLHARLIWVEIDSMNIISALTGEEVGGESRLLTFLSAS